MKETLVDLKERRSCRKYLPQQITDEQLNAILEAGTYAPTGMGKQSPVIVVLQKPELISEVAKMNAAVMGRDDNPFTARDRAYRACGSFGKDLSLRRSFGYGKSS